jgi:carboxypeptidase family protein
MFPDCNAGNRAAALLVVLFSSLGMLLAQSSRGTIAGSVKDSTGAVVPGAKVTVTNAATGQTVDLVSNSVGEFTAADVPVGTYNIRIRNQGFREWEIQGLNVDAGVTARADAVLQVGQAQQTVEVQATSVQLNSEDSRSAVTVNQTLVNTLPLEVAGTVRSPFDLASLTPEAKNTGSSTGFALGGGQADSYQATLDGVSVNTSRALQKNWTTSNAPSIEAITQFSVDTNGFKAEYGHAGGGVMMFVAKSGTNQFHGSAYEFLRNNNFDANDWFSNRAGKARQIYKQNDFGGTIGGPVWIPKVYNGKNKTFFFFSYYYCVINVEYNRKDNGEVG